MPSENVEEDFHCHFFPLSSSLHCLLLIFFSGGGLRSASFILADNLISDLIIRPPFHWTLLRAAVFAGSDGRGGGPSAVFEPLQSLNPLRLSGCILAAYQCLHLTEGPWLSITVPCWMDGAFGVGMSNKVTEQGELVSALLLLMSGSQISVWHSCGLSVFVVCLTSAILIPW